jgi:SAM-dependent methyltransferase
MSTGYVELARVQQERWQWAYAANPLLNGSEPSRSAREAARMFAAAGIDDVLELGAGSGRDALHFARHGLSVHATDFSDAALDRLRHDARRDGLDDLVSATLHDVRDPLPPADGCVGAVYAHRLLGMALSRSELRALVGEIRRVLRPGGLLFYTVLHTGDAGYATGSPCGDELYEDLYDDEQGLAERYFNRALVDELAAGWALSDLRELTDGSPARSLWRVTQAKAS